jgi:predicted O-linked N-acetylglucosamine transferase (SPINDLY family)
MLFVMELSLPKLVSVDDVSRAFTAGRFGEVEEHCKCVLAQAPETPWAWHFLGRLPALDAESAIDFLGTALSLSPDNVQILCDLSRVLARSAQFELAVERAQQAVALQPHSAPALIALAEAHGLAGQQNLAWPLWERAVVLAPSSFAAQLAYGQGLQQRGRSKDALKHLKRAATLEPNNLEALFLLAKCYAANGQHKAAVEVFTFAQQLSPAEAWLYYEGARSWFAMADLDRALAWVNQAIAADSAEGCFYEEQALYLHHKKDFQGCIVAVNKAIERGWVTAKIHAYKAQTLTHFNKKTGAIASYIEALKLDPQNVTYLGNLAGLCLELGILSPALEALNTILAGSPDNVPALINKAKLLKDAGRVDEGILLLERAIEVSKNATHKYDYVGCVDPMWGNYLFTLLFAPSSTPAKILERHLTWGAKISKESPARFKHRPETHAKRAKIRVGYMSADLRQHSVTAFIGAVFKHHDPAQFEIFAYTTSATFDAVSAAIKGQVFAWRDVAHKTIAETAQIIHEDQLDILVELSGHTQGNRLEVCALKPAPIQVTYLGYPSTTGLKTIDYRLTDAWADPVGLTDAHHCEKLMRIPDCGWCYEPVIQEAQIFADAPPVERNGFITFGSFNNIAKFNAPLCDLWVEILQRVPESRLRLKAKSFFDPEILLEWETRFTRAGIARERLIFMPHKPQIKDHLAVYNEVDIALDSYPYHGTTTTCEALAAGVPVVSLAGSSHVARVGVSLLNAVGLSDLIAEQREAYIAIAVKLAADRARLRELRTSLGARMKTSVLGDAAGFTRKLEGCFRQMVAHYRGAAL